MGTMIEFARPDGGRTRGYLATAGRGRPGIVVIQEWWGLNDQICGVADRFARAGYNALAPDLYKGRLTSEPDEANHLMSALDFADATHQDVRGAARHLQGESSRVAVMGLCMCRNWPPASAFTAFPTGTSPIPQKSACRSRDISPIATIGARRPPSTSSNGC